MASPDRLAGWGEAYPSPLGACLGLFRLSRCEKLACLLMLIACITVVLT